MLALAVLEHDVHNIWLEADEALALLVLGVLRAPANVTEAARHAQAGVREVKVDQ